MSDNTGIEWTDHTWNPLTGCTKVSPGCDHCYAKTMHERFNGPGSFDTVTLHPGRLRQPLSWRKPARVFVNSMSDLFHQDVPDEYIARVFAVMAIAQRHTFQVLTKRHARMRSLLSSDRFAELYDEAVGHLWYRDGLISAVQCNNAPELPLPNVWLGVSVENQQWADIRIPALLGTPAAVRFLSCEPLLGPVGLCRCYPTAGAVNDANRPMRRERCAIHGETRVDWVIVGGESGQGARPMSVDWARTIRDQCVAAGVPFLFKQWGAYDDWGRHLSKKLAGRTLDGRTWDEYPQAATA